MNKNYGDMDRKELIVQLEGRDSMIEMLTQDLNSTRKLVDNCLNTIASLKFKGKKHTSSVCCTGITFSSPHEGGEVV